MKKVAITGSTGILGNKLQSQFPDIEFFQFNGDIRNADAVKRFCLAAVSCDVIIHLAALVPKQAVDRNTKDAFDVNVGGTLNILESLRGLGDSAPLLFFASSSHVYASSSSPLCEDGKLDPFTFYGLTKLQAEDWCRAYAREYGLNICIGRIFSFTDPKQSNLFFIPAMFNKIKNADKGEVLNISGVNGKRDFLSASQVCNAISFLCKKRITGSVNIASGTGILLIDVIYKIINICGRDDLTINVGEDYPDYHVANVELLSNYGLTMPSIIDDVLIEMSKK